ncbi:mechanosensitive ion channel family protein [Dysgonomonas massiliensis]|uniref:mechanosensitive ion channel family protein n=1 Tax=Dysgonomonas massiliensis TaxID=2040292 RepID=UPI000C75F323|nr:mechanosensitive ion channel domain-containing protein [Dysgonomonas massiliensis]
MLAAISTIINLVFDILNFQLYQDEHLTIRVRTIVFAIVVFIITCILLRVVKKAIVRLYSETDKGRIETVFNYVSYFVYLIVFFSLLSGIGVNITMFLTASAALFVGLGFALQQIFQDLIAGIYILFDKTLNVGDIIHIEGKVARVKVINLRSTIAETRDRRIVVIPNRMFINDVVNNWTQDHNVIRATIEVGVYIGTDVQLVKKLLLKSVENVGDVLKDPAPIVMLDNFGESSVRFCLRYFICDAFNNDRIASDIRFEIDRLFKENGVKLPVPVLKLEKE